MPVRTFIRNGVAEYLNLDNRFLRTVYQLLIKPGYLTTQWIAGRRASHTAPVRLYLIVSLLYFSVLAFTETTSFFNIMNFDPQTGSLYRIWLPRMMFLMMPLFAVAVMGLHYRLKRYYVEHLVFSVHLFCFIFTVNVLQTLLRHFMGAAPGQPFTAHPLWFQVTDVTLIALPVLYLGIALRAVYRQRLWLVVMKTFLLYNIYFLILVISALLIEFIKGLSF